MNAVGVHVDRLSSYNNLNCLAVVLKCLQGTAWLFACCVHNVINISIDYSNDARSGNLDKLDRCLASVSCTIR